MHTPCLPPSSPSWNQKPCQVPSVSPNSGRNGHDPSCWAVALLPDLCRYQTSQICQCSAPSDSVIWCHQRHLFWLWLLPGLQGQRPMGEKSKCLGLSYWGHCSSLLLESWIGTGAVCISSAPPPHVARYPKCWLKLDMQIIKSTTTATRALYKNPCLQYDNWLKYHLPSK